jgi:hypothetical protein
MIEFFIGDLGNWRFESRNVSGIKAMLRMRVETAGLRQNIGAYIRLVRETLAPNCDLLGVPITDDASQAG